jgi:DNA-binding MarR family transcriptional regulator
MPGIPIPPLTTDEVAEHLVALAESTHPDPPAWVNRDLTFGQLRFAFLLSQTGPQTIGQLAHRLGVSAAAASEQADRLERHGLLTRHHRDGDRRVVDCALSDRAQGLLADIRGTQRDAMRRMLAVLASDELAEFDSLLRLMAERLAAQSTLSQGAPMTAGACDDAPAVSPPGVGR